MKLKIDDEFKNLIPPLDNEEVKKLEENIKREGCLDPLIVWKEEGFLLDGHHRYEICERNNIKFQIRYISLKNRTQAKIWIYDHQRGTRNLTSSQKAAIAVELDALYAIEAKESQLLGLKQYSDVQKSTSVKAARPYRASEQSSDKAGKKYDVSGRLVRRAKFVRDNSPKVFEEVKKGKITATAAENIVKLPEDQQDKVIKNPEVAGKVSTVVEELNKFIKESPGIVSKGVKEVLEKNVTSDEAIKTAISESPEIDKFLTFTNKVNKRLEDDKQEVQKMFNGADKLCFAPRMMELICKKCNWGFDVYLPLPVENLDKVVCPYCGQHSVEKRDKFWVPTN